MVFISWLIALSVFGSSPGTAGTIVHLEHFFVTYHLFHRKKGSPFADDQGIYNCLTWWEQIDNGKQLTLNRKFFTVLPVLYRIASHTQIIRTRCSSSIHWPYLCWWLLSSPTCTRSVYLGSMPIVEL
ncbi:hypothetical protein V6N13_077143 [Hibiscus sabdariffa]|uniref:Secreted protein n=1 Tax=Hibiscus sabdariffa TaxID=183260 RepID=A0ABR2CN10_9ROSI